MQLDVFNGDAFSVHSLTAAINKIPFQPGRIGKLGLFKEGSVATTSVDVESVDGQLTLIQSSPRGSSPVDPIVRNRRSLRTFRVPHFERDAFVYADEVQNLRAFGQENVLETVQSMINQKLELLTPMHDVTLEYQRLGAIQGLVKDADGTTLFDLFTEFGETQQTQDFAFSSATLDVRNIAVAAKRLSEAYLGGLAVNKYRALCGKTFFDTLVAHASVKETFKYQQGQVLGKDLRDGFEYGDVIWEEYRGAVTKPTSVGGGTANLMDDNQAWLVPDASIFISRFAPADFEETVNTLGLPRYAKQFEDPSGKGKFRGITTQSNVISLCLRPQAVIKLTKS